MRFLLLLFFNYRQQNDQLPFNSFLKTHSLFVLHFPQALCYQRSSQSVFIVCLHAAHWIHLEYDIHFPFPWDSLVAQRVKHLPTTWETQVRSLGQEDPLEKEMATHSSTFVQKIPWMEKTGGLYSMGLQRVGHD